MTSTPDGNFLQRYQTDKHDHESRIQDFQIRMNRLIDEWCHATIKVRRALVRVQYEYAKLHALTNDAAKYYRSGFPSIDQWIGQKGCVLLHENELEAAFPQCLSAEQKERLFEVLRNNHGEYDLPALCLQRDQARLMITYSSE